MCASDATGRELPAWLDLQGKRLLVRIDDTGAQYPVVVDPFVQVAELLASDGKPVDLYGYSVAISGDGSTVVVGAIQHGNSTNPAGAAYVFVEPVGGWANANQVAELTASDASSELNLGQAVSIIRPREQRCLWRVGGHKRGRLNYSRRLALCGFNTGKGICVP